MKRAELEKYLLSKPDTRIDYPFGEDVAVYKVKAGKLNSLRKDEEKMFALIPEKKDPVNISLKCDPNLAEVLRKKYESVQPGYHLSKKHWNTIVLSGQIQEQELKDLIDHSYKLVCSS